MASALRVAMVSASFHPYVGGAEKQALELSRALLRRGAAVTVLTRRMNAWPRRETVRGVPVERLAAWGAGPVNALVFMAALFRRLWRGRNEFDVLHAHLAGSPALAAAVAGRVLGKPVFIKLGGGRGIGELAASSRTWFGRLKLRVLAALKPRFVAVSADLRDELKAFGLGAAPLEIVPNGVDAQTYHPVSEAEKKRLRERLGWPEGLCFLYVGRLSWEKRLVQFLETWSAARERTGARAFAALVGAGPEEAALKNLSARLDGRVVILPPTDAIAELYAAADVFILPSISEGLSNALLEAMASGLAILASRVGGSAEAVEEGRSGFLFPPEDVSALEGKLAKIFARPERAAEMGRAARERALARYAIDATAGRYEAMYRGALA